MVDDATINNLPREMWAKIYADMQKTNVEIMARLDKQNLEHTIQMEQLKSELLKKDRAIETLATSGVDIREIHQMTEIGPVIDVVPEEMQFLLENNKYEYLKTVFRKYNTLLKVKMQSFEDHQLDINGDAVNDMLNECVSFFDAHRDVGAYNADDVKKYAITVNKLVKAYNLLIEWKKLHADVSNFNEACAHATFHYGIAELKASGKKAVELSYNPEEKVKQLEATIAEEKAEEQKEEEKEEEVKVKLVEQEKKLNAIEGLMKTIIDKMAPATNIAQQVAEEVESEEKESEPDIKAKKKK